MLKKLILFVSSFIIVSLGQPAHVPWFGPLAAVFGFALIFWFLIDIPTPKKRFYWGWAWCTLVQLFQLSWSITHPYAYIYPLWLGLSALFGAQFGVMAIYLTRERLQTVFGVFFFPAFWVLMEWARLFLLSGFSWNPVGLALTTFVVPFQAASILGVFGLSFLVILTNILTLKWLMNRRTSLVPFLAVASFPYVFGIGHMVLHHPKMQQEVEEGRTVDVLLVQTAFPVEEVMELQDAQTRLLYTYGKWKEILSILSRHHHRDEVDMIVFPEYVVPYGTYYPVYPLESVKQEFRSWFGEKGIKALPELEEHLAMSVDAGNGKKLWMVNNAFWMQGISNLFNAEVVAGLEDTDVISPTNKQRFCSAMVFFPNGDSIERYSKRVLVPLGEYIPFEFLREIARNYDVAGSFTPGSKAKVITGRTGNYGLSICYEETYGNVMRDNRLEGAEMLVNLTNDFWYPRSLLMKQHFDHAKVRAVEMGIPLVRATNTGITAAVDSLGQTLDILGEEESREHLSDALFVTVPRYHYRTLYTYLGDSPLMLFSALFVSMSMAMGRKKKIPSII